MRGKTAKRIGVLLLVVGIFAAFHLGLYRLVTCRLFNTFGSGNTAQMIDVKSYLPFEEGSKLPKIETSWKLSGELPVLDGAAALVPVYAAVIENLYPEGCVTYEGGSFSDDNYYGENFAEDSVMQYKNTVRGFEALLDGETDLFFSAAPSEAQRKTAEERGVALVSVPIGLEAFVFFVNAKNPVDGLTVEQVREIYAGEIKNWAQVGGPRRVINPVTRTEGSGSQTAFEAFMGEKKIGRKSFLALAGGSLAFSFRFYMGGIVGNEDVKMLELNGVYPSEENIRNRSYPVVVPFYVLYRADNEKENLTTLVEWLLSEEGQSLIEKTGYVGIGEKGQS